MNRWRNIALGLMFFSFFIMYLGVFNRHILPYLFAFGSIVLFISILIYFRLGALSFRIPQIECPNCHRMTKVLGDRDGCMFCKTRFKKSSNGDWELDPSEGHAQG